VPALPNDSGDDREQLYLITLWRHDEDVDEDLGKKAIERRSLHERERKGEKGPRVTTPTELQLITCKHQQKGTTWRINRRFAPFSWEMVTIPYSDRVCEGKHH
jgi:hypothetical protein